MNYSQRKRKARSHKLLGGTLDIHRVAVHPAFFRRGIARGLLGFVLKLEPSATRAIVQTGSLNDPARRLYESLGFEVLETREVAPELFVTLFAKELAVIEYQDSLDGIMIHMLHGFFDGWPKRPSPQTHLRILQGSLHVVLALQDDRVIGFVNAVGDGVFYAYIPLLEVLPSHKNRGIGTELMRRMLEQLRGMYAVDVLCDPGLQTFYERLGMMRANGMAFRQFDRQSGE